MRISAKGRYALAAVISMAQNYESAEPVTVISISEKLGISKIYLEQVFSLLKRGGIVNSLKGSQGGYQLARMPQQITLSDVLSAVELSIFEPAEDTVSKNAPEIETAMRLSAFDKMDEALKNIMSGITLQDLAAEAEKHKPEGTIMFYI
ncbi:MAG: RrF2 family transcriptional regulator [Bacillota bacterium]